MGGFYFLDPPKGLGTDSDIILINPKTSGSFHFGFLYPRI